MSGSQPSSPAARAQQAGWAGWPSPHPGVSVFTHSSVAILFVCSLVFKGASLSSTWSPGSEQGIFSSIIAFL